MTEFEPDERFLISLGYLDGVPALESAVEAVEHD